MPYRAEVLLDSVSPANVRLTTFVLTYPRFVHAELLTHRVFSRNASSSRAIPVKKLIDQVADEPVLPVWWGRNQPGMQARDELDADMKATAQAIWLEQRDVAVAAARRLVDLGSHKQIVNRILEPWMWITVVLSGTTFDNFFWLRCHQDAQPEIRTLAELMREAYRASAPRSLAAGDWHLPFLRDDDTGLPLEAQRKVAVARCARVSYLTHFGVRDVEKDLELHDRLLVDQHLSPFEHVAMACGEPISDGNFTGWRQYRSLIQSAVPGPDREADEADAAVDQFAPSKP
jgi:thymidylate synthase ThyX